MLVGVVSGRRENMLRRMGSISEGYQKRILNMLGLV